jgi:uncharacterized membrane protein YidH (DUF202 family)
LLNRTTGCVCLFPLGGYFLGKMPAVKKNFTILIVEIIIILVMLGAIEYSRRQRNISRGKSKKRWKK